MTKPIILIPLSVIVPCDPNKSKQAFAQLGITTWQFIRHWFAWDKLIMRYRFGRLGPVNFKNELKKIFPVLNRHSNDKIDDVWDQMCDYNEHCHGRL